MPIILNGFVKDIREFVFKNSFFSYILIPVLDSQTAVSQKKVIYL